MKIPTGVATAVGIDGTEVLFVLRVPQIERAPAASAWEVGPHHNIGRSGKAGGNNAVESVGPPGHPFKEIFHFPDT